MFAHGSNGDADHRRSDADAYAATVADANFRSDEAAGSRADVSAKHVSYDTTYCVSVVSADWPTDRGADASTVSSTDIVTDCPADSGADTSTFGAANCATDYSSDGVADDGADGGASTATDIGTDGGAYSITFSAANCAADSVSHGGTVATTLGAADDSFADGEAFRGTDDGADGTTIAPADYFAANHITTTYSDSDHEYAYDVNSDVCSHRLAVISTRATPYGAALQHTDDRSAVASAVAEPNCIADEPPVAAAEPCSLGNSDCEPDGRADSPPIDLARTDHVRSVAVADDLAGPDDRAHAARTSRSAGEHHSGSGYVGRDLDRRGLRRRGEHLPFIRRRYPCGGRGFDRPPAAEALVVHRRL